MSLPYRPESFCWITQSYGFTDQLVQALPALGLSILYGRQVSTYGTTPRPRITLWLRLCLVYLLLPWVLLPRESWFWAVPCHSTCVWLYLFPYKCLRRSTSEISKGNVLGYYHNLGSLRYFTRTVFLAVLCAAVASFEGIWDAAAKPLVCFLVLHEPMDVQLHCVIKKGFSWRGKKRFSHTSVFNAVLVPYLREPRLR